MRYLGLLVAGSMAIACVAGTRAGDGSSQPASARCPEVSADTRDWRSTVSFEFGVAVLHPPNYERKIWGSVSPGHPPTIDLWRRPGAPAWVVQLELLQADSMFPFSPSTHARTLRCTMRTRSGEVPALLERVAKTRLPTERDSLYLVRLRLPRSDGRTVIAFRGSSIDSAGYVEQIAIAGSLRLLEMPAPDK
jgi:hypothetical protein